MIKNVIFDFGNVIGRFQPTEIAGKYTENNADAALLAEVIFGDRWADLDAGRVEYAEYIYESLTRLPERLHDAATRLFRGWCGDLAVMESTERLIDTLRARGYGLYILSNAPVCFSESVRENYPITAKFDGAVYSAEIRMEKPKAEIYRHLIDKYELDPDECLFLDDKPVNVEGARACGMHAEVYDGNGDRVLALIEQHSGRGIVDHGLVAKRYFLKGYNCAQAVFLSFNDRLGFDERVAMKLSSSFGGGMGRMREVCGAVSGMFMVLGILHGYDANAPTAKQDKQTHYAHVQELARRFRGEVGSIECRELLEGHIAKGSEPDDAQTQAMRSTDPTPTPRSEEYYQKRPCGELVCLAARLLEQYLRELEAEKG